jgi:multiple sugar transport system permease protein
MLLSPWILSWALFSLFPIFYSLYLSFTKYSLLSGQSEVVGFDNYITLLQSPFFWNVLLHTVLYTLGVVPGIVILALGAALLVNAPIRFRGFIQASFFLPGVISVIIVAIVFRFIYAPDGMADYLFRLVGVQPPHPPWLINTKLALPAIMSMSVWARFGFYMVLYVAALNAVPRRLYEAAAIDGANIWHQFWYVTLPHLRPTTVLVVVLATINAMQVFPEILVMTEGGPLGKTTTVVYYLYTLAFEDFHMGKASALSYILFAIILVAALVQMRLLKMGKGAGD